MICFYNFIEKKIKDIETGEERIDYIPMLKYYKVFNVDQCEGIEIENKNENIEDVDIFIKKADPIIKKGSQPSYVPEFDYINMPDISEFFGTNNYYKTLFHELTHWTGHKERLNRI